MKFNIPAIFLGKSISAASGRSLTIDVAKGIGILLVVLGHNKITLSANEELFRIIYSFHVPLFFVLSGVLLKIESTTKELVVNKVRGLVKPYFLVILSVSCLDLVLNKINGNGGYGALGYLLGVFYGTGATIKWVPMWFLPNLFLATLMAVAFLKPFERISSLSIKAFMVLLLIFVYMLGIVFIDATKINGSDFPYIYKNSDSIGLPWSFDLAFITAPLIVLGYLLREYMVKMEFNIKLFSLALMLFLMFHLFFDQTIDLNRRVFNGWVANLQMILGIYLVVQASSALKRNDFVGILLAVIGESSLFILIFHAFFQEKLFFILSRFGFEFYPSGLLSLMFSVFICVIALRVIKNQNKIYRFVFK